MLVKQLKNYLDNIEDDVNVLVFVSKIDEERQLIFSDIDINQDGNIVIDAEYIVPPKHVTIKKEEI